MIVLNKLLKNHLFILVIVIIICCFSNFSKAQNNSNSAITSPLLYKKIPVPEKLRTRQSGLSFGGDIRIGDLTGDGKADLLVYRGAEGNPQGATKPCYIGAFTTDGNVLWETGRGGVQPYRPGPVAIHDIDNDGQSEVVCFFHDGSTDQDPFSLKGITIQIFDGKTGKVEKTARPEQVLASEGKGPNWVHQRILIANFTRTKTPQDFVVKLGKNVFALDHQLNVLWSYHNPWYEYGKCPAYIPSVGDIDGDGKDEVNGGYFLLDEDGSVMWEKRWGLNMDAVTIAPWDNGNMRAFGSGYGHIWDKEGNVILKLGKDGVPHGQELRVADFLGNRAGPEMLIRFNGHTRDVMVVGNSGQILKKFKLNHSPNNTGMTEVYWHGKKEPALLYNGGMLWAGNGAKSVKLPNLPEPVGDEKMGWYHCIPANLCGDDREEVLVYNPWDQYVYIFTPPPVKNGQYQGYEPGPRQYNVRLMD